MGLPRPLTSAAYAAGQVKISQQQWGPCLQAMLAMEDTGALLRFVQRPNRVALSEGEAALRAAGRYSELVALYQERGQFEAALGLLRTLSLVRACPCKGPTCQALCLPKAHSPCMPCLPHNTPPICACVLCCSAVALFSMCRILEDDVACRDTQWRLILCPCLKLPIVDWAGGLTLFGCICSLRSSLRCRLKALPQSWRASPACGPL